MSVLAWAAVVVGGYGLGCFNSAYYLVRGMTGADVRESGSGNAGARNAGRAMGTRGFTVALAGDVLKGSLAVLLARSVGLGPTGEMAALLAAVAGHIWPVQLGWRGGKGAATALGGLLVVHPILALEVLGTALVGQTLTKSSIAGGIVAMLAAPGLAWFMGLDMTTVAGLAVLAMLLVWTHRSNLGRLLARLRV